MICPKCQTDKDLSEYYATKSHKGSWCKECMRASCRRWAAENPEKAKANKQNFNAANKERVRAQSNERVKKFHALNREKVSAWRSKWRAENPDKHNESNRSQKARQRVELRDTYVKKTLGLTDAPQVLIELQRVRLQIKRQLREMK